MLLQIISPVSSSCAPDVLTAKVHWQGILEAVQQNVFHFLKWRCFIDLILHCSSWRQKVKDGVKKCKYLRGSSSVDKVKGKEEDGKDGLLVISYLKLI